MSALAKLFGGSKLISKAGELAPEALGGKTVLLYFSASWCPPCRGFTPQLVAFYEKHHEAKNFEVVFVSWDEEEEDFAGYFEKMPWKALPLEALLKDGEALKNALNETYKVESIPTLIALDPESGNVFTSGARTQVVKDPEGQNFPWSS